MSGSPATPSGDSGFKFKPPPNLKSSQKSVLRTPKKPPRQTPATPVRSYAEIKEESENLPIEEVMRRLKQSREEPKVAPDPFVKSDRVYGLNEIFALKRFLGNKDAAFVLFYDPTDSQSHWVKPRIAKAAEITQRDNHAYVAVNCLQDPSTCNLMDIRSLPAYVLYARGIKVKAVRDVSGVTSEQIKKFVEKSPTFPQVDYSKLLCTGRTSRSFQPTKEPSSTPSSSRLRVGFRYPRAH